MIAYKLPDDRFVIPVRLNHENTIGEGLAIIRPDHSEYDNWVEFVVLATPTILKVAESLPVLVELPGPDK